MKDLYSVVTNRIITALEQGTPPWICPWRDELQTDRSPRCLVLASARRPATRSPATRRPLGTSLALP